MARPASEIVASALADTPSHERGAFLRHMLAHAAAGIVVLEGSPAAAEALYRVADAVVGREASIRGAAA